MKTFFIKTLGCKTNQIESAIIEEKLLLKGYQRVDSQNDAQFFILNSCSVTSSADSKALSILKAVKKANPSIKTILTGCYAQLEADTLRNNPYIDYLAGNNEKCDIPHLIEENKTFSVTDIFLHKDFRYEKLNTLRRTRAAVKIQDGCNNRCSYCTIPLARGFSRSNSIDNIIYQINLLIEHGYKEVVFTGIHIGQWGEDFNTPQKLINLLEAVEKETDFIRYRLGSLNPLELNDEFIDFLSSSKRFCPHFHLSLQSLCDKTLANMNRHYSYEMIFELVQKLNSKFILPFLGSDIITGFPGETDDDFAITYENLKKLELSQIHVFPYSKRKNTKAVNMANQIKENIKKERVKLIKELSDVKLSRFLQSNIGTNSHVIIENKRDKKTGCLKGMTPNYINVLMNGNSDGKDSLRNVYLAEISQCGKRIIGRLID